MWRLLSSRITSIGSSSPQTLNISRKSPTVVTWYSMCHHVKPVDFIVTKNKHPLANDGRVFPQFLIGCLCPLPGLQANRPQLQGVRSHNQMNFAA
jgi:hypothetical protein